MPFLFARPDPSGRLTLAGQPVLESWMAAGHPDQQKLTRYLDDLERLTARAADDGPHLAIELRVGLTNPSAVAGYGHDLDNYVYPVVRRLGADRFDAVFADKHLARSSTICIGQARLAEQPVPIPDLHVRTTASSQTIEWKQQIHRACKAVMAVPLPPGPVTLDLCLTVAKARNWSTLWKPAIDALGPMLGMTNPDRPFHPRDDRVVSLGLHRAVDDRIGWEVVVDAWWPAA